MRGERRADLSRVPGARDNPVRPVPSPLPQFTLEETEAQSDCVARPRSHWARHPGSVDCIRRCVGTSVRTE